METPVISEPEVQEQYATRDQYQRPTDRDPGRQKLRIRRLLLGAGLLVVGMLVIGWGFTQWSYAHTHVSTDDAQIDGHIVPVLAKVGGYVEAVVPAENAYVAGGTVLVRLDDAELRERLAQAEADLAAAEAMASGGSQAQVATAFRQEAALEAQITAARANALKAEHDLQRTQELADQNIVSQQQLDAARTAVEAAHANVQALTQQAAAANATVSNARSSVKLAAARLASAQAAVENARLQLSYAQVKAPASGTISKNQVEVGQLVQPGQPLMAIVADTSVWVTANFKETDLASLRVGQTVTIDVDAYPDCTVPGAVESISAATGAKFALLPPDNATGNFTKVVQRVPVRIAVTGDCGADHALRPGLSTVVHVNTSK